MVNEPWISGPRHVKLAWERREIDAELSNNSELSDVDDDVYRVLTVQCLESIAEKLDSPLLALTVADMVMWKLGSSMNCCDGSSSQNFGMLSSH